MFFLLFLVSTAVFSQVDSSRYKKRQTIVKIAAPVTYAATLTGFYYVWYRQTSLSSFHFFDDNAQWLQIDKVGHFATAYHMSRGGVKVLEWAGLPQKKARIWGSLTGVIFQTPIEILDGFSADYGASWGDLVANTAGSGVLLGQYLLWNDIRIHPKFSFHMTPFAQTRPNILGSNVPERILKDYNGQTYWLSVDVGDFFQKETGVLSWLQLSVGYGGSQMIYGREKENISEGFGAHRREYYLSLDVNLERFKSNNKFLNTLIDFADIIKIPAPTLMYTSNKFKVKALYY